MGDGRQVLDTAKAALDSGLITNSDYDSVKDAFLRAQQIKAGLDAGFIRESDYNEVKQAFLHSLRLHSAPAAAAALDRADPTTPAVAAVAENGSLADTSQAATLQDADPATSQPPSAASSPQKAAATAPPPAPPVPAGSAKGTRTDVLPTNIPALGGSRRPKQSGTSMSGIIVHDDAVNMYYYLKAKSTYRWAMWKINDAGKEVILSNVGEKDSPYQELLDSLPETDCRFAVYDYQFSNSEGIIFNKLVFISWAPDTARIKAKMMYASTKDFFKGYLDGLSIELQASELDDITENVISEAVRAATTRS